MLKNRNKLHIIIINPIENTALYDQNELTRICTTEGAGSNQNSSGQGIMGSKPDRQRNHMYYSIFTKNPTNNQISAHINVDDLPEEDFKNLQNLIQDKLTEQTGFISVMSYDLL